MSTHHSKPNSLSYVKLNNPHAPFNVQLEPFIKGTPSSIHQQVLRKLCAKFNTLSRL